MSSKYLVYQDERDLPRAVLFGEDVIHDTIKVPGPIVSGGSWYLKDSKVHVTGGTSSLKNNVTSRESDSALIMLVLMGLSDLAIQNIAAFQEIQSRP